MILIIASFINPCFRGDAGECLHKSYIKLCRRRDFVMFQGFIAADQTKSTNAHEFLYGYGAAKCATRSRILFPAAIAV
jgi:hypothetical protein